MVDVGAKKPSSNRHLAEAKWLRQDVARPPSQRFATPHAQGRFSLKTARGLAEILAS